MWKDWHRDFPELTDEFLQDSIGVNGNSRTNILSFRLFWVINVEGYLLDSDAIDETETVRRPPVAKPWQLIV